MSRCITLKKADRARTASLTSSSLLPAKLTKTVVARTKAVLFLNFLIRYSRGPFRGSSEPAGSLTRIGMAFSGVFMIGVGVWIFAVFNGLLSLGSLALVCPGLVILFWALRRNVSAGRANFLALSCHLCALLTFYFLSTRFLSVVYGTDSIIATYMGVVRVLHLQDPYLYSIKPFLEQFGLPQSFYTPRVDGSFEFHLNYPAVNFLSFTPLYLLGIHDLRDGVLLFHVLSLLVIFWVVPGRFKALSLAPFTFYFPWAVAGSLTDSVWAFALLLSAVTWYRSRKASFGFVGLAGASKQLAFLVLPYLLVRNWRETEGPRLRSSARMMGYLLAGFWIPNLPFLFISPHGWWEGVVAPYLPGTTPQIMGGIGLSEVLTSMGLNPPSSVFFLLMGLAFAGSLFAYSRWFERMKNLVWLLPLGILFFYYRSFPNYMLFWLIPLIPDLARMRVNPFGLRPSISSMPTIHLPTRIPRFLQGGIMPSLMLGLVLTTAFVGASGAYISRNSDYKVTVHVDSIGDPDSLGVGTLMKVTVSNIGTESVLPQFFVKFSIQPFLWSSLNATRILKPDTSGSYTIVPSDPVSAVPNNEQFHLWVFDSTTGNLIGQSQLTTVKLSDPTVLNPQFRWWTLDLSTGVKVPYGWKLETSDVNMVDSGIAGLDQNWTAGVRLKLNYTATTQGVAYIALVQKVADNVTVVDVAVERGFSGIRNQTNTGLFGATLTDGNHVLDLVFSDAVTQQTVRVFAENTTVTLPLPTASLTWMTLEVGSLWASQGWGVPRQLTLGFFIQASSSGVYYAQIGEILQGPRVRTQ